MGDYIVRATAANNQIRAFAATTKEMVEFKAPLPEYFEHVLQELENN